MSVVTIFTLEDFVGDLQRAFATHDDLVGRANAVAKTLQHLLQVGGWVQEMLDKGGYDGLPGSTYVDAAHGHPAPGFHTTCGAHRRGQSSGPYDHGASGFCVGAQLKVCALPNSGPGHRAAMRYGSKHLGPGCLDPHRQPSTGL